MKRLKEEADRKEVEILERLCFNILDIDGDGLLSIVDLLWLTTSFSKTHTTLGKQVHKDLYEEYMDKNVT